jgi:hypothetical protein
MVAVTGTTRLDACIAARVFFTTIFAAAPTDTALVLTHPPHWRVYGIAPSDVHTAVWRALRLCRLGADVYVHCGLQHAAAVGTQPGRGRAEDVVVLTAVWADVDVAKPWATKPYLPDRAAAQHVLRQLPLRPTVVVWSGAGFHWWWCFKEALVLASAAARAQAERLVRRWQGYVRQRLGGYALDATHDLARVLRVPGTLHTKYGTPVVLEDASGPYVDPSELEDVCAHLPDVTPVAEKVDVHVGTIDPAAEPPAEKFQALCARSPLFAQLWSRMLAPKDGSQSGFDYRLATLAAEAGWGDDDIAALLVAHGRTAGRAPKPTAYYTRTIARARSPRPLRIEVW